MKQLAKHTAIGIIRLYRYLASPWVGNQCRFYPTCSHYAEEAFQQYGFFKGCFLTLKRLLKCHPFHSGGIDFVPGTVNTAEQSTHPDESTFTNQNGSK